MVQQRGLLSDPEVIKNQFPIFSKHPKLVYLDNAATTQRSQSVIDRISNFHQQENASIRRGAYRLASQATLGFEAGRAAIAYFFGASSSECIAFTSGTTESINIVARAIIGPKVKEGSNIVVTLMEHHANFIPWQVLCQEKSLELRVAPLNDRGELDMNKFEELIDYRTVVVAVTHISNTLGTINPISEIIQLAHRQRASVLIDVAQSATLYPINVQELDCDFLVCSAHKMFGPFGVGILYVNPRHHQSVQPYNYGGGIIHSVTVNKTDFLPYPRNLEAGTPNVAGVIGNAEAIRFIQTLDRKKINQQLHELTAYARQQLAEIEGLSLVGNPNNSSSIVSFTMDGMHPHDISSFLNEDNIAVRAGQHCTQPLLDQLGLPATVRASFSAYNCLEDVDKLVTSLREMKSFWT